MERAESESSGKGQWGGGGDNVKGRGRQGTRGRECDLTFKGPVKGKKRTFLYWCSA